VLVEACLLCLKLILELRYTAVPSEGR